MIEAKSYQYSESTGHFIKFKIRPRELRVNKDVTIFTYYNCKIDLPDFKTKNCTNYGCFSMFVTDSIVKEINVVLINSLHLHIFLPSVTTVVNVIPGHQFS